MLNCCCVDLVCVFPAGVWVVVRIGFAMQSSGAQASETSAIYCPALITATSTAGDDAKTLAVTSSHRHVQPYPTSHLVTNRSYTASKLTSDYVSEMSAERPSEMAIGMIPPAKSESKIHLGRTVGHGAASHQRKDSTGDDNDRAEYVAFIHPSSDCTPSTSGTIKTCESPSVGRKHRIVTSVKNDALYSEIKGDDDADNKHYADVLIASGSAAAWKQVVDERDKLLQRVSRLTTEKQDVVYRLRDFVRTNGELHDTIAELQNKLREVEATVEREQREKALLNSRLTELTSTECYVNRHELSNDSQQLTLEGATANTGDDSFIISNRSRK